MNLPSGEKKKSGQQSARDAKLETMFDLLHQVGGHSRRVMMNQMAESGVSMPQWLMLDGLCYDNANNTEVEGFTMRMLSERIGAPPSSITGMVDALVERGLVDRKHDATDRRVVRVTITQSGIAFLGEMRERSLEVYTQSLSELDEHELEMMHKTFTKILTWYSNQNDRDSKTQGALKP